MIHKKQNLASKPESGGFIGENAENLNHGSLVLSYTRWLVKKYECTSGKGVDHELEKQNIGSQQADKNLANIQFLFLTWKRILIFEDQMGL